MNIIVVDDEPAVLSLMGKAIPKAAPGEAPVCFSNAQDALQHAKEQPVDVAFLDIEMGDSSGLQLAKVLTKIKPDMNIIFVTGYTEYMDEAFQLYASGYVRKPPRVERLKKELQNLRYKPEDQKLPDTIGAYAFDHSAGRVFLYGKDLLLTPMQYKILIHLMSNPGKFLSAKELYAKTTGLDAGKDIRTLYVRVSGLRKKLRLDDAGIAKSIDIEHQRGKGYRLMVL